MPINSARLSSPASLRSDCDRHQVGILIDITSESLIDIVGIGSAT
jgi:hypothetical protein